ncbi:MAG: phage baseplate assembly protein [Alphaproteobacteria bacterium]
MFNEEQIRQIAEICKKATKPLDDRLKNLVRLGAVKLVKGGKTQSLQLETMGAEVLDNAKFLEPYGLTVSPLPGSESLVVNVTGNPFNNVVLVVGNREVRLKDLGAGQVALYDASGTNILLGNDNSITVTASKKVKIITKAAEIEAETAKITAQTFTAEATTANIKATAINLAEGGLPVARLGDEVEVDPVSHKGKITTASTIVKAG